MSVCNRLTIRFTSGKSHKTLFFWKGKLKLFAEKKKKKYASMRDKKSQNTTFLGRKMENKSRKKVTECYLSEKENAIENISIRNPQVRIITNFKVRTY